MAKVTTGTGDTGYTGLLGEQRVPKYDPRPDTFGTVDEATSPLGLARAMTQYAKVKDIIYLIQQELWTRRYVASHRKRLRSVVWEEQAITKVSRSEGGQKP